LGVLQPIGLVETNNGYQIGFGRRRIKAARLLGMVAIPANIYPQEYVSPATLTLIENKQRSDNVAAALDAIAQLRLIATQEEICYATGLTQPELDKAIKLLNGLTHEMQAAVKQGKITSSAAMKATKLPEEQQRELSQQEIIKPRDISRLLNEHVQDVPKPTNGTLLQDDPEELNSPVELSGQPQAHKNIAKDSWRIQAKPMIMKLLEIVPKDEEAMQYIQLLAQELKIKG
jgi:ParB family transcriptional regulator, chromosome partitioning protein